MQEFLETLEIVYCLLQESTIVSTLYSSHTSKTQVVNLKHGNAQKLQIMPFISVIYLVFELDVSGNSHLGALR